MNKKNSSKSAVDNLAFIRADYEGGLCSKRKIIQNHNISYVNLWRYAIEGNWKYGWKRDQLMQEVSETSVQRLMALRSGYSGKSCNSSCFNQKANHEY